MTAHDLIITIAVCIIVSLWFTFEYLVNEQEGDDDE